jgi:hypothetical protein
VSGWPPNPAELQRQADVDPDRIGVLGLSMGGEDAIGAADPAIRAVVAEGATHRTAADKAGYLPGGITGTIQRGMDRLTYGVAARECHASNSVTRASFSRPRDRAERDLRPCPRLPSAAGMEVGRGRRRT